MCRFSFKIKNWLTVLNDLFILDIFEFMTQVYDEEKTEEKILSL